MMDTGGHFRFHTTQQYSTQIINGRAILYQIFGVLQNTEMELQTNYWYRQGELFNNCH